MDIVPFGIGSQNPGYCTILVLDHTTLDIAPFGIGSHKRGYCGIWQSITAGKHLQSGRLEGTPELGREDLEQVAPSVPGRRENSPKAPDNSRLCCAA